MRADHFRRQPVLTANVRVAAGAEAVALATFASQAGARLMQLHKGSPIAAVGTLEQNAWTAKDGSERRGWRLTAHEVLTVYQARKRLESVTEGVAA